MNNLPNVSVIVPVFNSENTLKQCIESILNTDYPKSKREIVVVDNNSNNQTKNILNMFKDQIKIVHEYKKGAAAARNKGIENSGGDIIAFTDSDCVVDSNWLKNIVKPLADPEVGISGGKILAKTPCNSIEKYGEKIHDHKKAIEDFNIPYVITMNWASRTNVLKDAGMFNEDMIRCQDSDLSRRIFNSGYRLVYVDEAIVYHSNRKTLSTLFYQGYIHGYWGIKLNRYHKNLLYKYNYRRFNYKSYLSIVSNLVAYLTDRSSLDSLYYCVFNTGKKIGKLIGSVRFFYLEI